MDVNSSTHSITNTQKAQIEDWLRLADKHIRAARYLAADGELQKIFTVDPENEIAESYQDRIQFFIKQLSQRVGMNVELQADIRKYNDRLAERNRNRIQSLLVKGQRSLDEGYVRKATEYVRKVLVYDPENVYAHALQHRINTLPKNPVSQSSSSQSLEKLRTLLHETWRNGAPSQPQRGILNKFQEQLSITDGTRLKLEREVRNSIYKNALKEICINRGISAIASSAVDTLIQKFAISSIEHSFIEGEILKEIRSNKIRGSILVIDEDNDTLHELTGKLRNHAYAVTRAGSIHEAVQALKASIPDVVISEVNFGGAPLGFELFEFIRNYAQHRLTPFFFVSQAVNKTAQVIGKRLGVDDFFNKPIDYDILFAAIGGRLSNNLRQQRTLTMQS